MKTKPYQDWTTGLEDIEHANSDNRQLQTDMDELVKHAEDAVRDFHAMLAHTSCLTVHTNDIRRGLWIHGHIDKHTPASDQAQHYTSRNLISILFVFQ